MKSVFTVDVEDWFHILNIPAAPRYADWEALPSIVEKNTGRMLDIFDAHEARATFFFLGWIARRYPHIVKRVQARGHEIASHGYRHRLVYTMTREEFLADTIKTKSLIEDITGEAVNGYRAAGFSVIREVPWFFEALAEAGHRYDSSVFPAVRGHGGQVGGRREPHAVATVHGEIMEFPISVASVLGVPVCFFGGGYFRLFPYWMIRRYGRNILSHDRPVIFYLHPRELDQGAPRLSMSAYRRFKSYVNLGGVEAKLRRLLTDFEFVAFSELLMEYRHDKANG